MKKIIVVLIVLAVVIFGLFWLSWKLGPDTGVNIKKTPTVIGFSLGVTREERWLKDKELFVEKVNELGGSVSVLITDQDVDMQILHIRNLIAQGVKVIVVVPSDFERIAPVIEEAHDKGVKIIAYDRMIDTDKIDLYVSFDNVRVGEMQAQAVVDRIGGSGKIAYIGGSPTDNNAYLLKEGSMNVLQPYIDSGAIEIVVEGFMTDWNPSDAYETVKDYLLSGGQLDGVVAANDGTAFGSINALSEFDLDGIVPVSGQDAELAACQRVVSGSQTMTVYKPIRAIAHKVAEIAFDMSKGIEPNANSSVLVGDVPVSAYLLEPTIVSTETMQSTVIRDRFYTYEEIYGVNE